MTRKIQLITHAGTFHADEVMSTALLYMIYKERIDKVIRVNEVTDEMRNNPNNIIYDIGFGEFDHHQKGGNGQRANGIPYASIGLLWKKFGRELCGDVNSEYVFEYVDKNIIQDVDAGDNGIFLDGGGEIAHIIKTFNPLWDSTKSHDDAFAEAVEFAKTFIEKTIEHAKGNAKAKDIILLAEKEQKDGIMVLDNFAPWAEWLTDENIEYVVFPSYRGGYAVQQTSFGRKFPEEWCKMDVSELKNKLNLDTLRFCHNNGFFAATNSMEDAIMFARKAIDENNKLSKKCH